MMAVLTAMQEERDRRDVEEQAAVGGAQPG